MNDSYSDFPLPAPLRRSVLYTGWKGASCVGLHSGAWLFLELLCESIWTVMFRRCSTMTNVPVGSTPEAQGRGCLACSCCMATGLASLPGGCEWGIEGGAEVSWDSLASIYSGQ